MRVNLRVNLDELNEKNYGPISDLIDDYNDLKNDNKSKNKEQLIRYQARIKFQNNKIHKIDRNDLQDRIRNPEYSDKKDHYLEIEEEIKKYEEKNDKINEILGEDLSLIPNYKNDTFKKVRKIVNKHKIKFGIAAGITALILGGVAISNKKDDRVTNYTQNGTTEFRTEEPTEEEIMEVAEATTEATTEKKTEATTEATTESTTEATTSSTEEGTTETIESELIDQQNIDKATDWFWKMNDKIDKAEETIMDDDKREDAKDSAKQKVIEYTDFIFYGTEIDGKTFEQLTDEEKSKVYSKYQELINTVNEKDPDYINNMSDRYKVVKDFGSLTLNNAKEKIKEKVGEEYYNSAGETGEAVKEGAKDTGSLIKKFVKDKYEEWRDNNKTEE